MTNNSFARIQGDFDDGSITIEDEDHLKSKGLQNNTVQKVIYSAPKCSSCNDEMQFSEGDVIYGDKWYHNLCWKEIQKMAESIS